MERVAINDLHLWQFDNLRAERGVGHFVTDRSSSSANSNFTLSYSSHPERAYVEQNRRDLAAAMLVNPERLYFPSQVHKTRIVNVSSSTKKEELLETDALVTSEKDICIAVMSADCVPILLYDRRNGVIAAIHSGWRGTVARILEKTLALLRDEHGTKGEDIIAGIGPSVSQDSYEVGEEVIDHVRQSFPDASALLVEHAAQKAKLDLWKANQVQLLEFGVPQSHIEVSDLCTVKNNSYFFSARKGDSGRFAAGIVMH